MHESYIAFGEELSNGGLTLSDFLQSHRILFDSPAALKLGKIHCTILLSDNLLEKKSIVQRGNSKGFNLKPIEFTPFGMEVGVNFTSWFMRKNVRQLGEIAKRVDGIIPLLTELKHNAVILEESSNASNYENLIARLKDFAEENSRAIDEFYDFVGWLYRLNELAPCCLFSHPPWSTTELSRRRFRANDCCKASVERATEVVFGLWMSYGPTLAAVRGEMEADWAESIDPEEWEKYPSSPITYRDAFSRATKKILNEFAVYFQKIRDSAEMVQSEINSFSREEILKSEEFLRLFIETALPKHMTECGLWDFKETISAWHNTSLEELKLDFACNVASFANSKGGLLVIGISDSREIVGIDNPEMRIEQSRNIIETYFGKATDFIKILSLPITNQNDDIVNCVIMIIPQTKEVIGVKEVATGRKYLYPVRIDTGIDYKSYEQVEKTKENVEENNFSFAKDLANFVYYG